MGFGFKASKQKAASVAKKGSVQTKVNKALGPAHQKRMDILEKDFVSGKPSWNSYVGLHTAEQDVAKDKKNKGLSGNTPVDANGNPLTPPEYQSIMDPKTGLLGEQYKSIDTAPWLQMQLDKENLMRGQTIDQSNQKSLNATSGALSNLAMNGGLRSGSAERIARGGIKDQVLAGQGVNMQSNLNRLNTESDAFDKSQTARQFDINTAMQDSTLKNASNLYKYGEQMKGWASGKQGEAIAKSGKK